MTFICEAAIHVAIEGFRPAPSPAGQEDLT